MQIDKHSVYFALALSGINPDITEVNLGPVSCKSRSKKEGTIIHECINAASWRQVDNDGVVTRQGQISRSIGRVTEFLNNSQSVREQKILPFCGSHDNWVEKFYVFAVWDMYYGGGENPIRLFELFKKQLT